jgi:heme-degrading monooxygenase HmoA
MIVEYIRYKIPRERQREFEEAYTNASQSLNASKHCQMYELARCAEEPELYILRIEWDSLDGHMKEFRSSPEFREFFKHVQPFFNDIQEMHHYELTKVTKRKIPHDKELMLLLRSWLQLPPSPSLSIWLITALNRACLGSCRQFQQQELEKAQSFI